MRMTITLQRILLIIAGIILALLLYIFPDMAANLGENMSFQLKGGLTILLLLASIAAEYKKQSAVGTFMLTAGIALALLLAFGGYIRLAELG